MKKVLLTLLVVLVAYFGYTFFMAPSEEQVAEDTFKEMALLDAKDKENDVSENDITSESEMTTSTNTETSVSIDAALTDMSQFNENESTDPFDGL